MEFKIAEVNMERFEKKINRIKNKCSKYGNPFTYEIKGECYEEINNPNYDPFLENEEKIVIKKIIVDIDGNAIINDWEFVANVEHTEKGNVFKKSPGIEYEIPQRYYDSYPVCEHCKTDRPRKMTYIVRNKNTNEFKQVGNSCLCDFIKGRSAEAVAQYISLYDFLISGEYIEPSGCNFDRYYNTREILQYASETVRLCGYVKRRDDDGCLNPDNTANKMWLFYKLDHNMFSNFEYEIEKSTRNEKEKIGFNFESEEATKMVDDALRWIATTEDNSDYIHNLKVLTQVDYNSMDKFGLLASIFPAYKKFIEYKEREKQYVEKQKKEKKPSTYVGEIGQRIVIENVSTVIISGYETEFGYVYIHKFTDENGNVYIWKSSSGSHADATKVKGTVKEHSEFRGVKQTVLTRCKVA